MPHGWPVRYAVPHGLPVRHAVPHGLPVRYAVPHALPVYTFSHCEPAPSQLNAAWGNSFRQLHSSFDNLLELRQISLE